jgi:hypothetical protein
MNPIPAERYALCKLLAHTSAIRLQPDSPFIAESFQVHVSVYGLEAKI